MTMGILEGLGLVAIWGAGAAIKHKTKLDHKAAGPGINLLLTQGLAAASNAVAGTALSVQDGIELFAIAEGGLNAAKGANHARKRLAGIFQRRRRR